MSLTRQLLSVAGLSTLAVSAAFAQSLPPSVAACAAEKDSLARLVCFDREVAKYTQPAQPAARVAPTPAAPAAAPAPAAPAAAAADEFGVSGKLAQKRKEAKEGPAEAVKELHASVARLSNKPYGEFVLSLDNGQVWEQIEAKSTFLIKVGEGVVIKPAKFGSFMLTTDAGATTRVRRTQ